MRVNGQAKFNLHGQRLCSSKVLSFVFLLFIMFVFSCLVSMFSAVSPFVLGASNTMVSNEAELTAAVNNAPSGVSVVIVFDGDISLSETLVISEGRNITLTSTVTDQGGFYKLIGTKRAEIESGFYPTISVQSGGVLRLDCIIVTHAKGVIGCGVMVHPNGTLALSDGEISDNTGWGVYNCGLFEMMGGRISGNTAGSGGGGGVHNEAGDFVMLGGVISGNRATSGHGGGVYNFRSVFSLFNGVISNNWANSEGGGVYNWESNVTMSGGEISGNTAGSGGGGVSFRGDNLRVYTFELSGGTISDNTAIGQGGGISNIQGAVTMSGGKISENTVLRSGNFKGASSYGGGVYNYLGTFKLVGGVISSNTASNGGNVYSEKSETYYFGVRTVVIIWCMRVVFVTLGVVVAVMLFMFKKRRRTQGTKKLSINNV